MGNDLLATTKTFCWLGYNLWQVAWNYPTFGQKFGIEFLELDPSAYTKVQYKNVTFTREPEAPEIGLVQIVDPLKVQVYATCSTASI